MTHILKLSKSDPLIHVKAYGSVQILGIEEPEVHCEIGSPQLATLVEKDNEVFVTANASCDLRVPVSSSIKIEKVMGSAKISEINNNIDIERAFGNLVLYDIESANVEKVGGNFSVRQAKSHVQVEKVAGNLTAEDVESFACEKVGGNCRIKNVANNLHLAKAGGKFVGQSIREFAGNSKIGGSFTAHSMHLGGALQVGGSIKLRNVTFSGDPNLRAGGNIDVVFGKSQDNTKFIMRSNAKIRIKTQDKDETRIKGTCDYQLGDGLMSVNMAAGGSIYLSDQLNGVEDVVGDLSDEFNFEESAFSEMIRDRIDSATKMAEAKVKSAEIRLEQIREKVEKQRGFGLDIDFGEGGSSVRTPETPPPPVQRPAGKKGATDEERLMILQMLQDKKISVEDAETLFRALEE